MRSLRFLLSGDSDSGALSEGAECQSKQFQGIWLLLVMDYTLSSKDLDKRTCC